MPFVFPLCNILHALCNIWRLSLGWTVLTAHSRLHHVLSILLFSDSKRGKETEEAILYFERLDPIKVSHLQPLVVGGPT